MVLRAGLFKRFKCFWTSSFCLEAGNLPAQDSEIRPKKKKTAATLPLLDRTPLKCAAPIVDQHKFKENPQSNNTHYLSSVGSEFIPLPHHSRLHSLTSLSLYLCESLSYAPPTSIKTKVLFFGSGDWGVNFLSLSLYIYLISLSIYI